MRYIFLATLAFSAMIVFVSCKPIIKEVNHHEEIKGVFHGDKLSQGPEDNCTSCHGIHLDGNGWIPGCRSCHGVLWNLDEHVLSFNGVSHQTGFDAPGICGDCHGGRSLLGAGDRYPRPSCFQCHGDVWTALEIHNISEHGIYHAPGWKQPYLNCTSCHGNTLQGQGNAPSCFECHGAEWNDND